MKILFLAPEPFFQERGTPIAVRLAVEVLAQRKADSVDLLTYHNGETVEIENVRQHRIPKPFFVNSVGPGISIAKLICDIYFLFTAIKLVIQNRNEPYQLIHAVEESVFIAWLIKVIWKIPYVYDMDSSLTLQVAEKWIWFKPLVPLFELLEKFVIRHSLAVVPVCDALAEIANRAGSSDTHILRDVSLLNLNETDNVKELDLRHELKLANDSLLLIYIGNLEAYQGIDLLIDGFALSAPKSPDAHLVIIGGSEEHIAMYNDKVKQLDLTDRIHLVGPRPVSSLSGYLLQADILASPRTKGNNTPMKIYSYLHSGRAIIATRLPTHTQVLNDQVSMLVDSDGKAFGDALTKLFSDKDLRSSLGKAANELAESSYTYEVFTERLNELYDRISERVKG